MRAWNNRWVWRVVAAELQRLGGGSWPARVVDAPAGTGRFTAELAARGSRVVHLDRSPAMLQRLRSRHGPGMEVVGDLRRPPLRRQEGAVVLCLRLMQHLGAGERIEALTGLRGLAGRALVAYYPGWHYKDFLRRLRYRAGLPHRSLRPRLRVEDLREEAAAAGWRLVRWRRVLPLLSEYVLLSLIEA
ncbi:MAG: methyltransferase domain-containing protein [Planctomycetota bacterium]|nr:MAG: methyltransferase domain-containing protein [Planctomycetota bacterium]